MDQPAAERVQPLFFRQKDLDNFIAQSTGRAGSGANNLTPYEVCMSAAKIVKSEHIDGAQNVRGIWRLYFKTKAARLDVLLRKVLRIGEYMVPLYDMNPVVANLANPDEMREKIVVKDIPLSLSNKLIQDYLTGAGAKLTTDIRYANERDPNGKLTNFKNGDRFVYAVAPVNPILQRHVSIANRKCRIFHNSQFSKGCRVCDSQGHKTGDTECPGRSDEQNVTAFRSHQMAMSNFHHCRLNAHGHTFKSLHHAWLWKKAFDAKDYDLAKKIKNAEHAGLANSLGQHLKTDDLDDDVREMTHLLELKARQYEPFQNALLDTQGTLAAAIPDKCWGTGLDCKLSETTKPEFWPGRNMLGVLMMELGEKLRADRYIFGTDDNRLIPSQTSQDGKPEAAEPQPAAATAAAAAAAAEATAAVTPESGDNVAGPSGSQAAATPESGDTVTGPSGSQDNAANNTTRGRTLKRTPRSGDSSSVPARAARGAKNQTPTMLDFIRKRKPTGTPPKDKNSKQNKVDEPTPPKEVPVRAASSTDISTAPPRHDEDG